MGISYLGLIFLLCVSTVTSMYDGKSDVVRLTSSNFNKDVVNSADIWLVEFYAEWCGHCQRLAPEWEKAAKALKGIVKVGAVDMEKEKNLGSPYNIQGFPTIKFFGLNKSKPLDYNGERTADAIVRFILDKIREITTHRLSGKNSSAGSKSGSNSGSSGSKKESKAQTDKDVVILTDSNFDSVLMNSNDMWLVEFYAPWCGHCKKLEPEWNQAASELKGKIKVAKVDATVEQQLGQRFRIQGYPTIKIFPPGPKSQSNAENYDGSRDASSIVTTALEKLEKYGYMPDPEQLTNENQFKETCKDKTGVCILLLLPHIIDSSSVQRKGYLNEIKEASKVARGKPIYFFWAQGADFFDLEDKLHMSAGYPAVVALNFNKKKYSVCRSAFGADNLKSFVSNLLIGREPLSNLPELPKLKSVAEWDGKDAKVETTNDDL